MTVLDLITRSLNMIGWLQPSEVPSNAIAQRCLDRANSLLRSYNLDRNKIFSIDRAEYTMPAAQKIFSFGPGGDFNGPRPNDISEANLFYQQNPAVKVPLKILDSDQYAAIELPDIVSVPQKVYYDAGFKQTAPVGTALIYFWPVPNAIYKVEFFTTQALVALAALGTTLLMPDGYDRMIAANLAVEIAPELGRPVTPELAGIALCSMALVEGKNAPSPIMKSDPAIGSRRKSSFDYRTGEPY